MSSILPAKRNPMRMLSDPNLLSAPQRHLIIELRCFTPQQDHDDYVGWETFENLMKKHGKLPSTVESYDDCSTILFYRSDDIEGLPTKHLEFLLTVDLGVDVCATVYSAWWGNFVVRNTKTTAVAKEFELPEFPKSWTNFISTQWSDGKLLSRTKENV